MFGVLLCGMGTFIAQTDTLKKKSKKIYFSWGYTRAAYSKSTIHFKDLSNNYHEVTGSNSYYDFTVYNVTASDRPDFDKLGDVVNITAPQYVFRIGFELNNKWGVELNYDHTKYIVNDFQRVKIDGQISGNVVSGDTVLDPKKFLHFEHSDGANFWMINAVRKIKLYAPSKNFTLTYVLKPGVGVVIPRTDVTLFGERLNNRYHLAGWIAGVETGLRVEFFKNGFFELVGKGSFANYSQSLVLGRGNGTASHHFFTGQITGTIGLRFSK